MSQTVDIRELNERIESKSSFVNMITMGMDKVIVGQKHLVESLLIGLLSDGHILLEGVPGLAKTLAIKTGRCDRYDDLQSEKRRVPGKARPDLR